MGLLDAGWAAARCLLRSSSDADDDDADPASDSGEGDVRTESGWPCKAGDGSEWIACVSDVMAVLTGRQGGGDASTAAACDLSVSRPSALDALCGWRRYGASPVTSERGCIIIVEPVVVM